MNKRFQKEQKKIHLLLVIKTIQLLVGLSDWITTAALSLKNHEQLEVVAYFTTFNFFFFFFSFYCFLQHFCKQHKEPCPVFSIVAVLLACQALGEITRHRLLSVCLEQKGV